jgi:leader peptidase (prepilin peptidase)/N-methyltransferase
MSPAALVLAAVLGLAWGFVGDRIAARWPAHDDDSVRPLDWRTIAVAIAGLAAAVLTISRYTDQPIQLALVGLIVAGLVVLFATDLDQRLLPDVLTLPLIPIALAAFVLGIDPYVRTPLELLFAVVLAVLIPLGLFLLAIPFGQGAIGLGDLKLLFGIGLFAGGPRLFSGLVVGAILAAIAILVLVAARRITLRSYVPYGPFLILGCLWALLVLSDVSPT